MGIHDSFLSVLNNYLLAKEKGLKQSRDLIQPIASEIKKIDTVKNDENLIIKFGAGTGRIAFVPWTAILDKRETTTTRKGVYFVYLFQADMSGLYATIAQGVGKTQTQSPTKAQIVELQKKSELLRPKFANLSKKGFILDNNLDLKDDHSTARAYEKSVIAYKYYKKDSLPSDGQIKNDMFALLEAYNQYVESRNNNQSFNFNHKDFESTTGKKNDARYLHQRFNLLREVLVKSLPDYLPDFTKSYTSHPYNRGNQTWKSNAWVGFAHKSFKDRPQDVAQLQVGINQTDPLSIDLWLDRHAPKFRSSTAKRNIENNKTAFLSAVKSIKGYQIGTNPGTQFKSENITEENLNTFLQAMDRSDTHAYLTRSFSEKEVLSMENNIIDEILENWKILEPVYQIVAFGGKKTVPPTLPSTPISITEFQALVQEEESFADILKSTIAHIAAGKNIVFYGAPATSKTYLATKICEKICQEYSIDTANSEWNYFDVVGGLVPDGNGNTFSKGVLLKATEKCQATIADNGRPSWLIIDELNRANLDLAFGKIFTQLDLSYRKKSIASIIEDDEEKEFFIPFSFRIIATLNTYDKSLLFSMGYAFMRRFAFIPVRSLLQDAPQNTYPNTIQQKELAIAVVQQTKIQKLRTKTIDTILEHFSDKGSGDISFIFPELTLRGKDDLEKKLSLLKINNLDIIDLLLFLAHEFTISGIVEIGHAIVFDAAKFVIAGASFHGGDPNTLRLLDEAVVSYFLPQLEYFMPKLRKSRLLGQESSQAWESINKTVAGLHLLETSLRLKRADEEFRVIC